MIVVHVDLSDVQREPVVGTISFTPTRRLVAAGHVVLPAPVVRGRLSEPLAPFDIELVATDDPAYPGPWCYQVVEPGPGGVQYVLVPAGDSPVQYAALQRVDPRTLEPTAAPPAAWVVALAALTARVTELEALVGEGGTPTGGYMPDYLEAYL